MKKGESCIGTVERMDFPNKGIISVDGEEAVVKNALPGQSVSFTVSRKRQGSCEGRLTKVLKESPLETYEDRCPHFGSCGGCLMQSIPYEEQLKIKEAQIRDLLDKTGSDYEFEGILPSPSRDRYRNKMEFSFGDEYKGGELSLGMHKRGSMHDIVDAYGCRIVHDDFSVILKATRDYFASRGISFHRVMQHEGYLRHLLVRRASNTGQILAAIVTFDKDRPDDEEELIEGWKECLLSLQLEGEYAGILHVHNNSASDVVMSDMTEVLYGCDHFYEEILGLRFKISPFSFFQTNSKGAEVLYGLVRRYAGETRDKVIFDLYSGTGTIAQILAPVADKVIGVEIVSEAVLAARENAKANGLDNCEFIEGDVLKVIDQISDRPDILILDPPRDGINPKALDKIISFGVERIVYISCKPTSLVRDLDTFKKRGYSMTKACAVDMFPSTANTEAVALLQRKSL